MDKTTTKIYTEGVGRLGYARVLVEVNANKEIKDKIKMCDKDKNNVTIRFKFVNVVYAWKPLLCDDCKVFGHEWNVTDDLIEALRKSAKKYDVLEDHDDDNNPYEISKSEKMIIDSYVKKKTQPGTEITMNWSYTMVNYFKDHNLKKIDRVMRNSGFFGTFPNTYVVFVPHLTSDHYTPMINIPNAIKKKHKSFKFANYIADKPEFNQIVEKEWGVKVNGCAMFRLTWKEKVKLIQTKVDADLFNVDLRKKEAKTLEEYREAVKDEEKFLFQQAKVEWLKDGDGNSKFFHVILKSRANKNIVASICNEKYERLVNDEEFKHAMFDIDDNKAHGFSSKFFKQAWDVNATIISLVPKLDIPNRVSDFKPIKWPDKWKSEKPMIADIPVPRLYPNNHDTTIWITNMGSKGKFSVNEVWNDIRMTKEKIVYKGQNAKMVSWNGGHMSSIRDDCLQNGNVALYLRYQGFSIDEAFLGCLGCDQTMRPYDIVAIANSTLVLALVCFLDREIWWLMDPKPVLDLCCLEELVTGTESDLLVLVYGKRDFGSGGLICYDGLLK
ncbi:hypothetical protein Tco_1223900, partial [Tanacetum coccineum]